MTTIFFDITDIVHFAQRSNRLTGIQRVEFNLVNLISRKNPDAIRCVFFHPERRHYVEFEPAERQGVNEFNAEQLLVDLGLAKPSSRYPARVRIKSFLRARARNKWQRAWLKALVYLSAWFRPEQLWEWDLAPGGSKVVTGRKLTLKRVNRLPAGGHLVHLGSSWFFPDMWRFAAAHKMQGGDVVQYVHDLIPVTHPHFMPVKEPPVFTAWLEQALRYASRFPCNSRWTSSDLERFMVEHGISEQRYVVPLAHEFVGFARNSDPELPGRLAGLSGRRFVLCVGTIEERKNGLSLLKVWQDIQGELGEDTPLLVFAGRFGKIGGEAVRRYLESSVELNRLVRVIDGPSDQTMAWLYRNCLFSTYPSHVEGWGLPVGESAWFGRYCVASQASSIPEVCGDLMDYVDPQDLSSIKNALLKPVLDPAYLQAKEAAVVAAPLRTWQDVADELYQYITNDQKVGSADENHRKT